MRWSKNGYPIPHSSFFAQLFEMIKNARIAFKILTKQGCKLQKSYLE